MDRREFLFRSGLGIGAGALAACAPKLVTRPTPPKGWAAVKEEFALRPDIVHMSGFFLASHPRRVREAIERHRRALDADALAYMHDHVQSFELELRAAATAYLGVAADELAFTDSTTMGLGLVYGGVAMRPGQEILATTHDHIATTLACVHRAQRTGQPFRQISLYDAPEQATVDGIAAALAKEIRPETRIVAMTWVHSGTGVKLPIRALADVVARANQGRSEADRALLVVDGVHGLGLEDVDLGALGCDVFVAGTHKWIFGPRGTGIVWARESVWPLLSPTIPSFDPMWRKGPPDSHPPAAHFTPGGFHSFEHRWALAEAFRFQSELGRAQVAARVHGLAADLKRELGRRKGIRLRTPIAEELSGGITCFDVEGEKPDAVVARLAAKGIRASTSQPFYATIHVRLAPGLLTLEHDVERALAAL
jgi:isopenicillin-N epimerase